MTHKLIWLRRVAVRTIFPVACLVASHGAVAAIEGTADAGTLYRERCAQCHGADLKGGSGPSLTGAGFSARWRGKEGALHDIISTTMPLDAPGSLAPMAYNALTGMLLSSGGEDPTQSSTERWSEAKSNMNSSIAPIPQVALPSEPKHFAAATTQAPDDPELLHPSDNDWLRYNRDYAGQRYSPLRQITPDNVAQLTPQCIFQTGEVGSFQASPIIRGGRLYVTTAHRTYAVDAATCRRLWVYEYMPTGVIYEYMPTNRGVALYKGMVIRGTLDGHLIALDAMTGQLVWDTWVVDSAKGGFISAAPVVFDGKVYVGEAGADYGASGHVRAFDAVSGAALWSFNVIPADGEKGRETWPVKGERGGGSLWTTITVDPVARTLYASTGNPYVDFDGSARPGDNLYTDSVVVLNADTGKLKWYVQQNPHDVRDYDTSAAPMLYSARGRDMLAVGSKDGRIYFYDRNNHALLVQRDLIVRENATGALPPGKPTHVCPGGLGGVEWNGPAFDPGNQLVFVNTDDWCATLTPQVTGKFSPAGGIPASDSLDKVHGWLRAFDAATGEEQWHFQSNSPMLAGITPTGSGLLFTGTGAGEFLAFDAKTGQQLYSFYTGGAMAGGVSTYQVGDRQYVAVASGNNSKSLWNSSGSAVVILFSLPVSKAH